MMRASVCLSFLAVVTACTGQKSRETPDSSAQGAIGVESESSAAAPSEEAGDPGSPPRYATGTAGSPSDEDLGEGLGGAGGFPGTIEWNSCPTTTYAPYELDAWVPVSPSAGTVEETLAALRGRLVGTWRGNATPLSIPTYPIEMTFGADGHYSATRNPSDPCISALYWGTDEETDLKQFRLNIVDLFGAAWGELDIVRCDENRSCSARLIGVETDATGNRLRFDLHRGNVVHVELARVLPSESE